MSWNVLKKIFYFLLPLLIAYPTHAIKFSYSVDDETTSTVTKESFHRVFFEVTDLYSYELSLFRISGMNDDEGDRGI